MSPRLPPKARLNIQRFGFTCSRKGCFGDLEDMDGKTSFSVVEWPNGGDLSQPLDCKKCGQTHLISMTDEKIIRK